MIPDPLLPSPADGDESEAHLVKMLREDWGPDYESYLPLTRELRRLPEPLIQTAEITTLNARLTRHLQPSKTERSRWSGTLREQIAYGITLLQAELRLARYELWVASLLIMAIGVLVTVYTVQAPSVETLPFVYVAPIMAAFGVAFVFNPSADLPFEIMLACPRSVRLILLARLTLVFSFNLVIGLMSSFTLSLVRPELSLLPLITAWLAPMSFLSALAFFLAIFFKEPLIGGIGSMLLWLWQHINIPFFKAPVIIMSLDRPLLWTVTVLLGVAGLWLAGRDERWIRGSQ